VGFLIHLKVEDHEVKEANDFLVSHMASFYLSIKLPYAICPKADLLAHISGTFAKLG
jgi:hypothetical protein